MAKYNTYSIQRLSNEAVKALPSILNENGYEGRYRIYEDRKTISINSNWQKLSGFFHEAEARAKGENGFLVHIKKESFATLWVPEAKNMRDAYEIAIKAVENGYPVEKDPVTMVSCAEDNDDNGYREEWQFEYIPA